MATGSTVKEPQNIAIISVFAVLSIIAAIFVLVSYKRYKSFRRYPAILIFSRTLCDLFFALIFFIMLVGISQQSRNACPYLGAFWFVFSMASDLYFFGMCYDLYATLTNPFRHVGNSLRVIHICVWLVSVVFVLSFDFAGQIEFRSGYDICFTKPTASLHSFNWTNAVFLYIPNLISNLAGVLVLLYTCRRMQIGLDSTLELRKSVIQELSVLTTAFAFQTLLTGGLWLGFVYIPAIQNRANQETENSTIPFVLAFGVSNKCIVDAVTWWIIKFFPRCQKSTGVCANTCTCLDRQNHELSILSESSRLTINLQYPKPAKHVSDTLRQEVILHMKNGVTRALTQTQNRTRKQTVSDEDNEPRPDEQHFPRNIDTTTEPSVHIFDVAEDEVGSTEVPFTDYAPHVFRYLRQTVFSITDDSYEASISFGTAESIANTKFVEGGRSGAFLFFTGDNQYLIKTLTTGELKFLLTLLPHYVEHMRSNDTSLLARFCGLHSMTMYNVQIHFLVMDNVFIGGIQPNQKYDLKGSWVARHTNYHVEAGKLMKDEDFHHTLKLELAVAQQLADTLEKDSLFLMRHNIMDYSLLLGIYYSRVPNHLNVDAPVGSDQERYRLNSEQELRDLNLTPAVESNQPRVTRLDLENLSTNKSFKAAVIEGPGTYAMGIIDILAEYGFLKKCERFAKTWILGKDTYGISVQPPPFYQKRFIKYMRRKVLGLDEELDDEP